MAMHIRFQSYTHCKNLVFILRIFILMFLQDKRLSRTHGYCVKGQRAKIRRTQLPWGPRITAIPIICTEGLLDVGIYDGHVTGETFLDFVSTILTPCLHPFDGFNPRSVVILGEVSYSRWIINLIVVFLYPLYFSILIHF